MDNIGNHSVPDSLRIRRLFLFVVFVSFLSTTSGADNDDDNDLQPRVAPTTT